MPAPRNIEQLQTWLCAQEIDLGHWGQGQAKSVQDLWVELVEGESILQDNPPMRITHLVEVLIQKGDRTLVEARQTLRDERERPRGTLPSEKLKLDENPLAAARRCLQEELGVGQAEVRLVNQATREPQESISYPGLQTRYIIFSAEAHVNDLPDKPFSTLETSPTGDPVREHHWIWVKNYRGATLFEGIESD